MTTGRTAGGAALGCGLGIDGGLAAGGSPRSNRLNSSSQSLVEVGRASPGREVVGPELRSEPASSLEASVLPGCLLLLSHSTMMEPRAIARKIQILSMLASSGGLVASDSARIMGKVEVIDASIGAEGL